MSTTPNLFRITPFLRVPDLADALALFTGLLDFRIGFQQGNYAYVHREAAALRLIEEPTLAPVTRAAARMTVYIDVEDVAAIVTAIDARRAAYPTVECVGPVTQPYGQRELHLRLPDGNWLAFGQG